MKKEKWKDEQIRQRSREVGSKTGNYGVMEVKRREFEVHLTVLSTAERSSR